MEDNVDKDKFQNPPKKDRSYPFWSWNDKLSVNEIKEQIDAFDAAGIGGFFMHSREGLETEYLGDEWEECVKAAVAQAKEKGMYSWIYDEDRWPSGAAGGRVTACGDQNRAKAIVVHPGEIIFQENTAGVFYLCAGDGQYQKLENDQQAVSYPIDQICSFTVEISQPSEWFNNDAPADNLNPDCVRDFIRITYEKYDQWVGTEFGETVGGVFTDEPNFCDRRAVYPKGKGYIPFTTGLENQFMTQYGYSLFDVIPELFFDFEHSFSVRHDFWRLLSRQFTESYTRQIYHWCDQHHARFTGHFLYENDLGWATRMGGAVMLHYRHLHMPGVDMLCRQTDEYLTVLQCVSVGRQLGRNYIISEMYGCTGWDFDFEGQRWIGDWQFALGVNLRCQHLALYSIKGCRKRDFPPCFNYNTNWWHKNHLMEDYFARLTTALSEGECEKPILVLHPQSTAWGLLGTDITRGEWNQDSHDLKVNQYGYQLNDFLKNLSLHQIDFDLGDEQIMEELGAVEGPVLRVGKAAYRCVVIKYCQTLLSSTVKLLEQFLDLGGTVMLCDSCLERINGRKNEPGLEKLLTHPHLRVLQSDLLLIENLKHYSPGFTVTDFNGNDPFGILVHRRRISETEQIFFIVNNQLQKREHLRVSIDGENRLELLDCLTGNVSPYPAEVENTRTHVLLDLRGGESVLLRAVSGKSFLGKKTITEKIAANLYCAKTVFPLQYNVLVLDQARGCLEGSDYTPIQEVWLVQDELRRELGLKSIYYNGLEQRYKWIFQPAQQKAARLEFVFESLSAMKDVKIAVEDLPKYQITLNGEEAGVPLDEYYMDKAFGVALLPEIKAGKNKLVLQCILNNSLEMENIYLLGDFCVDVHRRLLQRKPEPILLGDYTTQGYFHYAGDMQYTFEITLCKKEHKQYFLVIPEIHGVNVEVKVNNDYCGDDPWAGKPPLEITDALSDGINQLVLTHTNTPRNLFGPFHDKRGKIPWTDWQVFRTTNEGYDPGYQVISNGLSDGIYILERDIIS